mmetsp:Transcript_50866/g.94052  ORF Transcript_50866/g.94052 Transcript_50866/m.94052 type:complete len:234 (-) Transcript_50866:753-1454(-)
MPPGGSLASMPWPSSCLNSVPLPRSALPQLLHHSMNLPSHGFHPSGMEPHLCSPPLVIVCQRVVPPWFCEQLPHRCHSKGHLPLTALPSHPPAHSSPLSRNSLWPHSPTRCRSNLQLLQGASPLGVPVHFPRQSRSKTLSRPWRNRPPLLRWHRLWLLGRSAALQEEEEEVAQSLCLHRARKRLRCHSKALKEVLVWPLWVHLCLHYEPRWLRRCHSKALQQALQLAHGCGRL